MATATEAANYSNISADTSAFRLKGGRYVVSAKATWGGGSLTLEMLALDGSTWVSPMDISGVANTLGADGSFTIDLPAGQFRINLTTATAVYVSVARVLP